MPSSSLDNSPNQVAVSTELLRLMRGGEDKEKGGISAIDITALVLSELYAHQADPHSSCLISVPVATLRHATPPEATPQALAIAALRTCSESSRSSVPHCASAMTLVQVRTFLSSTFDKKNGVGLPGDALCAFSPKFDEEDENRGFKNGHGIVSDRESPYLHVGNKQAAEPEPVLRSLKYWGLSSPTA